jgi:two-component system LytT family sensor kinase
MTRINNKNYYWLAQASGWSLYSFLLSAWNYVNIGFEMAVVVQLFFLIILLGIGLSHLYKAFLQSNGWVALPLYRLIPSVVLGSLISGLIYSLILASILDLFYPSIGNLLVAPFETLAALILNFFILFMLWSTCYLAYNYLKNYEREEINNLRLESSQREMEMSILKSQLNPHFIFNAMNSIRALVDEDPMLAKAAVTKLSNILRGTLMADKRNLVTIKDELSLVMDHLDLEKIRYEERLTISYDISPEALDAVIPPMTLQTLVENGIKHGISKLAKGGEIALHIKNFQNHILITIDNTGTLNTASESTSGIGMQNIRRRLDLIYGKEFQLDLLQVTDDKVRAELKLPKSNRL